jgi:60 kDa SS-A/Ro ribonucleoprotein
MSKFNTKTISKTKVDNLAGGESYKQTNELELISILLTSFVGDSFYEKSNDTISRLRRILPKVDPKFAAKAAIFARDTFGMRSITHVLAGELTQYSSGMTWAKNFYDKVVLRPDDMNEILAYYLNNKTDKSDPKFPNSLKKGFASAFNRFDDYQIAKYRSENKEMKLVDIVNLVHPIPNQKNKESLSNLISGDLKSTQTWESMLSEAGQNVNDENELSDNKSAVWETLLKEKKIGYFALLRNLRNIIEQSNESVDMACEMLTNDKLISKSRVLPFRFKTAYDEIYKIANDSKSRKVMVSIEEALNKSLVNVPKFEGETLVVIDVSGSMKGKPSDIASLFGAIIAKKNNCDVMTFSNRAQYVSYNPSDSTISIRNSFHFSGGGTNFKDIFKVANKSYDRIIILSDMQSWMGYETPSKEYNDYKKKFKCDPYVYSWDLQGLGTMQFPEKNVFALAGFSDKVFEIMKWLETDRNKLFKMIESIEI